MMIIENKDFCNGCDKHCPTSALQCGKGRRIFGLETEEHRGHGKEHGHEGLSCNGKEHDKKGHCCHGKEHGHDEHHRHEGEHCHGEHRDHRRNHEYGKHEKPWWEDRDELSALLGKCGHHLFKHPGKGRGQGQILRILAEKKQLNQRELQAILDIKPGSISEILSKLESKGYIQREKSEEDKRAVIVSITSAGEAALAERDAKTEQADLFACLTQEEKDSLQTTLTKLLNSWEPNKGSEMAK